MQIPPNDGLITVAYDQPQTFLLKETYPPSRLLYFLLTLKFEGEDFNREQRARLRNRLHATIEMFGGKSKAVEFSSKHIYLLIGLPLHTNLQDFIERLRIFFKSIVQRKMNAKQFAWNKQYQVSTVSFSEIETISKALSVTCKLQYF